MRAFAKHVGISASHLSRVLSGKKDLSPESATRIAIELQLSEDQINHFLDLVSLQSANSHTKKLLLERIHRRQNRPSRKALNSETFQVISDWYYFSMLELIRTQGFRSEAGWIARRLGLTISEVETAIQRLQTLGLIRIDQNHVMTSTGEIDPQSVSEISSTAAHRHYEQIAQKAFTALKEQPFAEREFLGIQLAFNRTNLQRAKTMIRNFTEQFETEFRSHPGEDVYQLNLQFFSLTKK